MIIISYPRHFFIKPYLVLHCSIGRSAAKFFRPLPLTNTGIVIEIPYRRLGGTRKNNFAIRAGIKLAKRPRSKQAIFFLKFNTSSVSNAIRYINSNAFFTSNDTDLPLENSRNAQSFVVD